MKISNLDTPIRITFSREPDETTGQGPLDESLFLKRKEMRYHNVSIPSYEAVVTVRIKPEKNISLRVYVKHYSRPTSQHYDFNVTLPNTTLLSCSIFSKDGNGGCSRRDPYEFDLLPNTTGHIGHHVIGVEILEDLFEISEVSAAMTGNETKALRRQTQYCVKVKQAPTPLPVKKNVPRQYDSKTDVKYKWYVTVGICVFWDTSDKRWSARGIQVSLFCRLMNFTFIFLLNFESRLESTEIEGYRCNSSFTANLNIWGENEYQTVNPRCVISNGVP